MKASGTIRYNEGGSCITRLASASSTAALRKQYIYRRCPVLYRAF